MLVIILLAIGLSMDSFAVAISEGISKNKTHLKEGLLIALFSAIFQMLMPLIGYFGISLFKDYIQRFDHIIAFVILLFLGLKMILEKDKCGEIAEKLSIKKLILLSLAVSMDALAAGVSLITFDYPVYIVILIIGVINFLFSFAGYNLGKKLGCAFEKKAEIVGGIILIGIGLKIFIEHTFLRG